MASFPAIVYLRRALRRALSDEQAIEAAICAIEDIAPGSRVRFVLKGRVGPSFPFPDVNDASVEWLDGCYTTVLFVVRPAHPARDPALENWVGEVTAQLTKRLGRKLDWPPTHRELLSSPDVAKAARRVWMAMTDFVGGPPHPPPTRLFGTDDPAVRAMLEQWDKESAQLRRLLDGEDDEEGGTAVWSPRLPKSPLPPLKNSESWPES